MSSDQSAQADPPLGGGEARSGGGGLTLKRAIARSCCSGFLENAPTAPAGHLPQKGRILEQAAIPLKLSSPLPGGEGLGVGVRRECGTAIPSLPQRNNS